MPVELKNLQTTKVEPSDLANRTYLHIWQSTSLWIVLFLIIINFGFGIFDPLKYLGYDRYKFEQVVETSLTYKIKKIESQPIAPDVVLLGSSVPMVAAFYSDSYHYPANIQQWTMACKTLKLSPLQAYPKVEYLERLLSQAAGKPITVMNLTCTAGMVSDACILLKQVINVGKRPHVIIYTTTTRDFVDNRAAQLGQTPSYTAFGNWQDLKDVLSWRTPPKVAAEITTAFLFNLCRIRTNLNDLAYAKLASVFRHPVHLGGDLLNQAAGEALGNQSLNNLSQATIAYDLDFYKHTYNPPNYNRFYQEIDQLKNMLVLCKANGITMEVVNMPITPMNKAVIDPALYRAYYSQVSALTQKYGGVFIDLDQPGIFTAADFKDSLHTNNRGGSKVWEHLKNALKI